MPIDFTCSGCQQTLRVPDGSGGREAQCPHCQTIMVVPAPTKDPALLETQAYRPSPSPQSRHDESPPANPYAAPTVDLPTSAGFEAPARMQLAPRGKRLAGAILDSLIFSLPSLPGIMVATMFGDNEVTAGISSLVILAGFLTVCLVNWVMISYSGQSIAKRLLDMRIVKYEDEALPGFAHGVVLRSWLPAVLACIPFFWLIDALFIFGEERRCVHDLIASTKVVNVE